MAWPSGAVVTTNVDAGTDNPQNARADLLDALQKLNQIIAHVTTFAQTFLDDADAAAVLATLGAAPLASPALTGNPTAPTPSGGDNDTSIATTAFVQGEIAAKAPLASPVFTGNPTAPTPAGGDNDTSLATTAFVQGELTAKAPLASPVFTGTPLETMGTGSGTAALIGKANVNTTAVGNVGTGTDDLMTYSLPANSLSVDGRGLRVTAWGRMANNANAKVLRFVFGSTSDGPNFTISVGIWWRAEVLIFRTGANAQDYVVTMYENQASSPTQAIKSFQTNGTATQTDTAAITVKFTGAATADNDIVQEGMLVEYVG